MYKQLFFSKRFCIHQTRKKGFLEFLCRLDVKYVKGSFKETNWRTVRRTLFKSVSTSSGFLKTVVLYVIESDMEPLVQGSTWTPYRNPYRRTSHFNTLWLRVTNIMKIDMFLAVSVMLSNYYHTFCAAALLISQNALIDVLHSFP